MDNNKNETQAPEDSIETIDIETLAAPSSAPPSLAKTKWYHSKKLLIFLLLIVIILAGAGVAWWFMQKNTASQTVQTQTAPEKIAKVWNPFAVVYAYEHQDTAATPGCNASHTNNYWRPIAGGDRTLAAELGKNNYVTHSGVYKNQVFAVTDKGCGSADATSVWYSQDSGKTYKKIYTAEVSSGDQWDQITSAKFSSDAKTLLIALLPADRSKNTIKEIDLDTFDTTDPKNLFSSEKPGIFLAGYDRAKKQVYYYSGCYNCDANSFNKLLVHDIAKDSAAVLWEDSKKMSIQTIINDDFSKILFAKTIAGDLGDTNPFDIEEFDIALKKTKKLATVTEESTKVGYTDSDGLPYYTNGKGVYIVDSSGKPTLLFEATKPVIDVQYIGKDQIILSAGTQSDYELSNYTISTKKAVSILSGDGYTRIFGVSWE